MDIEKHVIPVVDCSSAKELIRELDETHDRWQRGTWIFRGQRKDWDLHPSAMRKRSLVHQYIEANFEKAYEECLPQREELVSILNVENLPDFVNGVGKLFPFEPNQIPTPEELYRNSIAIKLQDTCERFTAYMFERHCDSSNLELPIDRFPTPWNMPVLLSRRMLEQQLVGTDETWRNEHMRVIYALAQHHGLPTRLLDWTYRPLVAAFFAGHIGDGRWQVELNDNGVTERTSLGQMVVWAVQQEALGGIQLQVVRHLRRQIGFLGAQEGVFAYDLLADLRRKIFGKWVPFDSLFARLSAEGKVYKLTLPYSERECLQDLLNRKKITKARLMPSFDNVADEVRGNFWQLMEEYS